MNMSFKFSEFYLASRIRIRYKPYSNTTSLVLIVIMLILIDKQIIVYIIMVIIIVCTWCDHKIVYEVNTIIINYYNRLSKYSQLSTNKDDVMFSVNIITFRIISNSNNIKGLIIIFNIIISYFTKCFMPVKLHS